MIWFFERGGQYLQYEIRTQTDGSGYEVAIVDSSGAERVERFRDPTRLIERSLDLQRVLLQQGWQAPASGQRFR